MNTGFLLSGRARTILHVALATVATSASADDRLEVGVRACAAVTSESERLDCFDVLATAIAGERSLPVDAAAASAAGELAGSPAAPAAPGAANAPAAAAATPPPLTDDVGKPLADGEESYAATVIRCEKSDATNRWYFYFDNGQVWRQSNTGRLHFRECAFDVTVTRDAFGFKMKIPSENETIRVQRAK